MTYLKLFVKFCILLPIAFTLDATVWILEGGIKAIKYFESLFDKYFDRALRWCETKN